MCVEEFLNKMDSHICGDCGIRFDNIEDFIFHKIHDEKLKLRLVPSLKIKDLLIPVFTTSDDNRKTITVIEDQNSSTDNSKNTWECDVCRKIFTDDFILQVHKKQFNDNSEISKSKKICNYCGVNFKNFKSFKKQSKDEFQCNYKNCTYTFKTKGSLKRHERRHTGERPYSCELCGRNFTESGALKRHKRSRISCTSKCDSDLPRYGKRMEDNKLGNIIDGTDNAILDDLDVIDDEINDGEKCQICDICDATFDTVKNLRNHLIRHAGKQYVKCGACKFVANDKDDVIEHIEKNHQYFNKGTPHEVEVNLIIHQDINATSLSEVVVNVLKCDICEQTFETDNDLKIHLLRHSSGIKTVKEQFSCLFCNKKFSTKSKSRKHEICHSEQRNFRCSECGKLFKRINHAREHIKTTHSNNRPFICVICKKRFKTMSSMKTHMKIHEGQFSFSCNLCDKSFREKASLQRHNRIHTGEKPYICRYCGHGFAEHGTLNRHLKAKLPCYMQSINQIPNEELNSQQLFIHSLEHSTQQTNLDDTFTNPTLS